MRIARPLAALVLSWCSTLGADAPRAAAQEYDAFAQQARLDRRLRAHPDDTAVLCELGWSRFRTHADQEGHIIAAGPEPDRAPVYLDRAIELLGQPTTVPLQRRLAACLYSRGRVAEATSIAGAIPFYERSLSLRASPAVSARLEGARRASAAGWAQVTLGRADEPPPELAALAGDEPRLVALWRSAAGEEVAVLTDDLTVAVGARRAGGTWRVIVADEDFEGSIDRVWIEAPAAGDALRVVVTVGRETRVTMDDGPEYGAYVHAVTIGLASDGALREVSRDPWW